MKKVTLTIAAVLFISGLSMAVAVPSGDGNDKNEASHNVGITIPTVALVDVEGANGQAGTINLIPDISRLEAGEAVDFSSATDNSLWLNYTSIVRGNNGNGQGHGNAGKREITVELDDEKNLPAGVSLVLSAGSVTTGKGKKGEVAASEIVISGKAQNVITGIGSCYTESGNGKGHQLTYTLDMDNNSYEELVADSYEVEITYTITDN